MLRNTMQLDFIVNSVVSLKRLAVSLGHLPAPFPEHGTTKLAAYLESATGTTNQSTRTTIRCRHWFEMRSLWHGFSWLPLVRVTNQQT
jgi:hypothetical protein